MTDKQPEALILAASLDELADAINEWHSADDLIAAIELLRTQHAIITALKQIISDSLAALGTSAGCTPDASLEFMQHVPTEIRATVTAQAKELHGRGLDLAMRDEKIAELEKDAARYRWLSKQFRMMSPDMGGNHCWVQRSSGAVRGPSVDEAVDAAMQQGERNE